MPYNPSVLNENRDPKSSLKYKSIDAPDFDGDRSRAPMPKPASAGPLFELYTR
jgi:hypothetical protein